MDEQMVNENRRRIQKSNLLLVCGVLAIYCICVTGVFGAIAWGVKYERQAFAIADATQQANATATAIVRATEQSQYEFIEQFNNDSKNRWLNGTENNTYWTGNIGLEEGVYQWDITTVKQPFVYWADYVASRDKVLKDYDIYVDTKVLENESTEVCSGLIFRRSSEGWDQGGYAFVVCNNGRFNISYHAEDWQPISRWEYSSAIQPFDWNRIEVSTRGDHFTFTINNVEVYEMTDNRQKDGEIALCVEVYDTNPVKVLFDNFGYQSR